MKTNFDFFRSYDVLLDADVRWALSQGVVASGRGTWPQDFDIQCLWTQKRIGRSNNRDRFSESAPCKREQYKFLSQRKAVVLYAGQNEWNISQFYFVWSRDLHCKRPKKMKLCKKSWDTNLRCPSLLFRCIMLFKWDKYITLC